MKVGVPVLAVLWSPQTFRDSADSVRRRLACTAEIPKALSDSFTFLGKTSPSTLSEKASVLNFPSAIKKLMRLI